MARPERRNAFDAALIDELAAGFADVGDVRAVVLSGDGPSFSAGADVEWMRASVDLSYDENVADALRLRAMLDAIDSCPAPVVGRDSSAHRRAPHERRGPGRAARVPGEAAAELAHGLSRALRAPPNRLLLTPVLVPLVPVPEERSRILVEAVHEPTRVPARSV